MKPHRRKGCAFLALLACFGSLHAEAAREATCPPASGVAVQVLGSGGPIADDGRASSAYLIWLDGFARVLVDAGAGAFLRFGEAGARFEDLDLVALSHFHTDHSADFPALLKSGYFSERGRPLPVSGPNGRGDFPGLEDWLGALVGTGGAYAYLSGYQDGSGGLVRLDPITVPHEGAMATEILLNERVRVTALGVPHGIVPALAYRVESRGKTIVFASDQNGTGRGFTEFARDADLLVAHFAIPENAGEAAVRLHARPSVIAGMASEAEVKQLVLSHFMARSLRSLDQQMEIVRSGYGETLKVAADLACYFP
jgi:ribonuclease BN (tRNA processing enzyme)